MLTITIPVVVAIAVGIFYWHRTKRRLRVRKKIPLPEEIKNAGESGKLVFFIGAGISRLRGLPSWKELADQYLQDLHGKRIFNSTQIKQFESLNPKQKLSISQLADKINSKQEIARLLRESGSESGSIYETIRNIGCVCVTTNYDELLIPKSNRIYSREKILPYRLNELGTIIHLHGCMKEPETMIVTTKDYLENYNNSQITYFLKYLFEEKTVVFLGYGLEEDEILEHLLRRGEMQNNKVKHFHVKGFSGKESHLRAGLCKYYEETFGINLLSFLQEDGDYGAIESILEDWAEQMEIQPPSLYEDTKIILDKVSDMPIEDILPRIEKEPTLCPLFFRKAEGLKWFTPLQQKGYFKPEKLPLWRAAEYLKKTAAELEWLDLKGKMENLSGLDLLDLEENKSYQKSILSIMEDATKHAKKKEVSYYQMWWTLAETLFYIPHDIMSDKTIEAVDYWLEDKNSSDLVAEAIGEKLILKLLNKKNDHADSIAGKLLSKLFRVSFSPCPLAISRTGQKAHFQFDDFWAEKIIEVAAFKSGEHLGREGVSIFHDELVYTLKELDKDRFSSMWRPAIRDHEQNLLSDNAENILIQACRDSLTGFIQSSPEEARKYLRELLDSKYITIQRIAIHCIGQERELYEELWDYIIDKKFFHYNFQHEIWHFLKLNYKLFTKEQKKETLQIIQGKTHKDEDGNISVEATARERVSWLKAIKDYGEDEDKVYQSEIKAAGKEPEHPDFSIYTETGEAEIVHPSSPYTKDEINGMEISDLVKELKSFRATGGWEKPSVFGFSQSFKDAIVSSPLRYFEHLHEFKDLDLAYVHSVITAYSELWREKNEFPWDDIWPHLLQYILEAVEREGFWDIDSNDNDNRNEYAANRNDVVKTISTLIKKGAQSDDHAFDEKNHGKVKDILKCLMGNQKGDPFNKNSSFDALTIAINSPRGQCLEALINVALRHYRLADKKNDGNHAKAWKEFQPYFDTELKQKSDVNYEFFALIPRYIPIFLYMSEEWLMKNLETIFDKNDNKKWTYAIHGYAYLSRFVIEVYQHLKSHGHIVRVLNDKNLPQKCSIRFVQNAVHSFLANKEQLSDEDSLIHILLSRGKSHEIDEIIHFVCSFRPEYREKIIPKVYELWPRIQKIVQDVGFSSENGCSLALSLSRWSKFLNQIDDKNQEWLLEIAPYTHSLPLAHRFLENLARLSERHPFEVNKILQAMIDGASEHTYGFLGSDKQIKTILENLVDEGKEKGKYAAQETVSKFAEKSMFQPSKLLSEILNEREQK